MRLIGDLELGLLLNLSDISWVESAYHDDFEKNDGWNGYIKESYEMRLII
jgi:hypothetical protein